MTDTLISLKESGRHGLGLGDKNPPMPWAAYHPIEETFSWPETQIEPGIVTDKSATLCPDQYGINHV